MASPSSPPDRALSVWEGTASKEKRKIYRVPDYINPGHDHFKPKELRLGLHTHAKLEGGMDNFKVAVARMVVRGPDKAGTSSASDRLEPKELEDFIRDLEMEGAEATYEAAPQQDPPELLPGFLLASDALFLCAYLLYTHERNRLGYHFERIFKDPGFEARRFPLYRDLMVMGNQVPMFLLLAVIKQLQKAEVSRKGENPAVETGHADNGKGKDLKEPLLGGDGDKNTSKKRDTELEVVDDAQATLNKLLVHIVAAVYPFTHGDELNSKEWKKVFKADLEKHHKLENPDALSKCEHILAAAYLAICGGRNPRPPDKEAQGWRWSKLKFCWQGQAQDSDLEDQVRNTRIRKTQIQHNSEAQDSEAQDSEAQDPQDSDPEDQGSDKISSATSLKKYGIKFKAIDRPLKLDFRLIQFKHSTLLLPKLVMDDHSAALFRNLALYEQMQQNDRSDLRTYLNLMDCLVDDPQDVRLLVKSGVIVNQLGSDEDVCKQWNGMCEGLFIGSNAPQYMKTLQKRIADHVRDKRNQVFADLRESYWENPLQFVALVVVSVVTLSTILQTIMAFISYFLPRSKG